MTADEEFRTTSIYRTSDGSTGAWSVAMIVRNEEATIRSVLLTPRISVTSWLSSIPAQPTQRLRSRVNAELRYTSSSGSTTSQRRVTTPSTAALEIGFFGSTRTIGSRREPSRDSPA